MSEFDESRRGFVKRAAYVAPAILTLAAAPEFAKAGSGRPHYPHRPQRHPHHPHHPHRPHRPRIPRRQGR